MPVILRHRGYRFFFYSNEGNPLEPLHVHVRKGTSLAKFWLSPEIVLAEAFEISPMELRLLFRIVEKNKSLFERSWNEYFGN